MLTKYFIYSQRLVVSSSSLHLNFAVGSLAENMILTFLLLWMTLAVILQGLSAHGHRKIYSKHNTHALRKSVSTTIMPTEKPYIIYRQPQGIKSYN